MENKYALEMYTEEEMNRVETYIQQNYGTYDNVFHELVSPDIHVDIAVIAPTAERNYYTLVTMGMGAHRMAVNKELKGQGLERAELLICLPPTWQVQNSEEQWYWPLRWLKTLARLPGEYNTWLGWGHTVPAGQPFAANTGFSGMLLISTAFFGRETGRCKMADGSHVNFYQLIPLYDEEMTYKLEHGTEGLLNRMQCLSIEEVAVVDVNRENTCI